MDNLLDSSYEKILKESDENFTKYHNYVESHEKLITNLITFRDTLEPEVLVPVCNRVLMRGNLIHTNEIMVSLGCGYFTKCSVKSAQEICLRRIKKANDILNDLIKEKDYLESQIKFREENIYSSNQKEIIEPFDEEADREWRKQHAMRLKEYRKQENKELKSVEHEEIIQKLELLELQEDIEKLYADRDTENQESNNVKTYELLSERVVKNSYDEFSKHLHRTLDSVRIPEETNSGTCDEDSKESLRKKLMELRERKKTECVTEEDIFKRLDELEEEEDIEDELNRLGENLHSDEETSDDSTNACIEQGDGDKTTRKRRVSFPKTDVEVQTININFKHTNIDCKIEESSQNNEITSPSDIYKMFPENFKSGKIKGIIKNCHRVKEEEHDSSLNDILENDNEITENNKQPITTSVKIGKVIERDRNEFPITEENNTRPISKFKSMRMAAMKK